MIGGMDSMNQGIIGSSLDHGMSLAVHQTQQVVLAPLINSKAGTNQQPQVACNPIGAPKHDINAVLVPTLASIIQELSNTVNSLSGLPGASQIISPDTAVFVQSMTCPSAPAQQALLPLAVPAAAKDLNNKGHSILQGSITTKHRQQPTTPPAAMQHRSSAQHSPITPNSTQLPLILPNPSATALQVPAPALIGLGPLSPTLLAGTQHTVPCKSARPRCSSDSAADDSSSDSDDEDCQGKPPSSKRVCCDVLTAQRALAAVMGIKQKPFAASTQHAPRPEAPPTAAGSAKASTPFGLPAMLLMPDHISTGQSSQLTKLKMGGAASLGDMLEAAVILTALHNDIESPMASSEEVEPLGTQGPAAAAAAVFTLPAPKPRGRPTAAKKGGKSRDKKHGKRELDADVPEDVREELRQMWEDQGHSLRVYCPNQSNGTRIDGIFRVVDGKKKIQVADGSLVDPVVFERAAERTTTRNWQISVLVEGINCKTQPGRITPMKLGQATRILGVHHPLR